MIVNIDDILTLIDKNPADFTFIPIEDIELQQGRKQPVKIWNKGEKIPEEKIESFRNNGVEYIDLKFSNSLYRMLVIYRPDRYKEPSTVKSFIEIDKIINTFESLNKMSKRKRYISFMYELYNKNDKYTPLFRFNEPIDYRKWNLIKRHIKKDTRLPILYNEIGIIVFVDLTNNNNGKSGNYIERFKKNVDLCSILTQRKTDNVNFKISSEFNRLTDIWTVNEPERLLDTYIERNAKLIVIGDKINDAYKSALLNVKKYDKYARYIVATDINPNDTNELLINIKRAYHMNNYSIE
ncbi:MAG: hypothetical protein JW864_07020 [Spirochaetes bacterium]|nr:hypothetical protein [Spirochaetota bacterium]